MSFTPSNLVQRFPGWILTVLAVHAHAQLAITEVMSSASKNLGTNVVAERSDFWELTNFSTNTVDLTPYRFNDIGGFATAQGALFSGRSIAPGESILFVKEEINSCCKNVDEFRAWWGSDSLSPTQQIYFYASPGFNGTSDAVQLWRVAAGSTTLVHRVELYQARRGFTFTYNPTTGFLDSLSATGANFAFKAVETDDVGSPGFHTGSIPLAITTGPQSQSVDGGTPAVFNVQSIGIPPPQFQWRFNGTNIANAISNLLEVFPAQPFNAGPYTVVLNNGLTSVTSTPAILQVNTNPSPPSITIPPVDLVVFPGQTAIFRVKFRGYPIPTCQWRSNNFVIAGATNTTLVLAGVQFSHAATYSVHIQNPNGFTNAAAYLAVQPQPNLQITEMMGLASTNTTVFGRGDWWELTNLDTNSVNLRGYRFDDYPPTFEGAVVITNDLVIQPGESVLFLQDMTPEFFQLWWGEENLPENIQFFRYFGNGITAEFDTITLWNAAALTLTNFVVESEYFHYGLDGAPVRGQSLSFWCEGFNFFGEASLTNVCGAVKAASSGDVASPGYLTNHPPRTVPPRAARIFRDAQGTHLTWRVTTGKQYQLESKDSLSMTNWNSLGQHTATNPLSFLLDTATTNGVARFYRLRLVP